jgi:hypothetical protein
MSPKTKKTAAAAAKPAPKKAPVKAPAARKEKRTPVAKAQPMAADPMAGDPEQGKVPAAEKTDADLIEEAKEKKAKEPTTPSTVDSPVKLVHAIADEMKGARRRDVIAACVAKGINRHTAATQYQRWSSAANK